VRQLALLRWFVEAQATKSCRQPKNIALQVGDIAPQQCRDQDFANSVLEGLE